MLWKQLWEVYVISKWLLPHFRKSWKISPRTSYHGESYKWISRLKCLIQIVGCQFKLSGHFARLSNPICYITVMRQVMVCCAWELTSKNLLKSQLNVGILTLNQLGGQFDPPVVLREMYLLKRGWKRGSLWHLISS